MSYCRFSCDDFQSDVYCYSACTGGFQIYVAARRYVFKGELPPPVTMDEFEKWFERRRQVMKMVDEATTELIDLPHAGGDFNEPDAAAAADRLEILKGLGYRVPQYAIDSLREEAAKEQSSGP